MWELEVRKMCSLHWCIKIRDRSHQPTALDKADLET